MVAQAVADLSDNDFEKFALGVVTANNLHETISGFTARLATVLQRDGATSSLLNKTTSNSRVSHAVLMSWSGDWNDAFAHLAVRVMERHDDSTLLVHLNKDRKSEFSVRQDCIDVWVENNRLDFLSATGVVSDDLIRELASKRNSPHELVPSINVASKESYVDLLTERMVELGALCRDDAHSSWRSSITVELFWNNTLSNIETIRNICAMMESRAMSEAFNAVSSASRLDIQDVAFVASTVGFKESAAALLARSSSAPTSQQMMLLEAILEMPGSAGLTKNRYYRYSTSDWVFNEMASRLTTAFKEKPAAWESFWTVYNQTSEASFNELVDLSLTLS